MDSGDMRDLLVGYLKEVNWSGGASKEDIVGVLANKDQDLLTMVNQYITEGQYNGPGDVLNLIPEQAWQASQGDDWRGATTEDPEGFDSEFEQSPVGKMEQSDVYHEGGPRPKTPGFGEIKADAQTVKSAGFGPQGGTSGKADPSMSGRSDTTGDSAH
jgi:hypothetical protein